MRGKPVPSLVQLPRPQFLPQAPNSYLLLYPFYLTDFDHLVTAAKAVRERAHAPHSHFKVGCAIEDENGRIFTGCNVENASYGLTLCAERVAVFKAISEGAGKLRRVAVVADTPILTPPCGACRQILWEFCGDAELILENLAGQREALSIKQLLPRPFDASFL